MRQNKNKMMMRSIITHDGPFHADDVMAIALIFELSGELPVRRTRVITLEEMDDDSICIIDVGTRFDPDTLCFDHHHDRSLPSACSLVALYLVRKQVMSTALFEEMKGILDIISEIDCQGYRTYNGFQFNAMIRMLDDLEDGFKRAIDICRAIIRSSQASVLQASVSLGIWESGEDLSPRVRCCQAYPVHWKRYGTHSILLFPESGQWRVVSADSHACPIRSTGNESFIHQSRFLAIFPTLEEAIACAMLSDGERGHRQPV
jgi:hypothetical protein